MEQRLSVITLGTDNLARARKFYETSLGWKALHAIGDVVFYQLPGFALAIYPRDKLAEDAQITSPYGFGGICLAINMQSEAEVDAVLREAQTAGGTILKPAQKTFWVDMQVILPILTGMLGR